MCSFHNSYARLRALSQQHQGTLLEPTEFPYHIYLSDLQEYLVKVGKIKHNLTNLQPHITS